MMRNVVLALSSLAVLVILFVGYTLLVSTPAGPQANSSADQIPSPLPQTGAPMRIGQDAAVPAGGKIVFRRYNEQTGRPTDLFSCQDWQPVPGSKNEIHATQPELAMVLPSGMVATILADEGQLTADRIERSQMRPKEGWLTGNVRIIIDRETNPERTPKEERPQDLITMHLDRLEFNLDRGELRTADHVFIESDEFEVAGSGLDLVWNQADNRVETLSLAHGEEFVFFRPTGLFDAVDTADAEAAIGRRPRPRRNRSRSHRSAGKPARAGSRRTSARWPGASSPSSTATKRLSAGCGRMKCGCCLTSGRARGVCCVPRRRGRARGRRARAATASSCGGPES